jgi:cytochrome c-type biogenesis protein CcmF
VQLNDLSLKVRLPEEALFRLLEADRGHEYKKYSFKTGASAEVDGLQLTFTGVDKQPPVNKQEGDVAIAAVFEVSDPESGKTWRAAPVFIIREGAVLTPKHYLPEAGLHLYLAKIDPATESFELMAVRDSQGGVPSLPLDIARKSYRTDYIVLEAIIFPGINLFWIGSILIMIGLSVAMVNRLLQNRRMPA